ncbi:MAG: hypothetical protein WBF81_06235, partial [Thermoplasmata archaeon]
PTTGSAFELVFVGESMSSVNQTIEAVSVSSPFTMIESSTPLIVSPAETFVVLVLLDAPSTAGSYGMTLTVLTD